eukprot:2592050-Prymnesium_polylepis.3
MSEARTIPSWRQRKRTLLSGAAATELMLGSSKPPNFARRAHRTAVKCAQGSATAPSAATLGATSGAAAPCTEAPAAAESELTPAEPAQPARDEERAADQSLLMQEERALSLHGELKTEPPTGC